MSAIVEHLIIGLAIGAVYSVIGLGFVLIYKGTGIFNLAQGSLMALGAFICYSLSDQLGLPFILAVLLTLVASFGVGLLIEFIFIRRLIGQVATFDSDGHHSHFANSPRHHIDGLGRLRPGIPKIHLYNPNNYLGRQRTAHFSFGYSRGHSPVHYIYIVF